MKKINVIIFNSKLEKLKKTVVYSDSIKIVDYLDGFQYAGNILQFFPHAEGYVKVTPTYSRPGDMGYAYNYVYNYTDHRSEEHTSELQSRENLVCRLLLEKKKKTKQQYFTRTE